MDENKKSVEGVTYEYVGEVDQMKTLEEAELSKQVLRNVALADLDKQALLHPFTSIMDHERTGPWIIESAKGVWIRDKSGCEYIDGVSGLACVNVGYGREEIAQALADQARKLNFFHTFWSTSHEPGIRLADRLISLVPGNMSKILFGTSGSDANDSQIKIVWFYNNILGRKKKKKIIARLRSYHGTTIAAASLTGQAGVHNGFDLPLPQMLHVRAPDFSRYADPGMTEREFSRKMADELDATIEREGPETVAAFIAEPVGGSASGVLVPKEGYWDEITRVLRKHDVLLIADEVVCGFGRTGKMFASNHYGLEPDLMTLSKGLTSGYVPMSACAISQKVMDVLGSASAEYGAFGHGYTNTAHPVCAAAALANLDIIERENLVEHAAEIGAYMLGRVRETFEHSPFVREIRGIGMIMGVEFHEPPIGQNLNDTVPMRILRQCIKEGALIRATPGNHTITLSPPLSITRQEADLLLDRFALAFQIVTDQANLKDLARTS